ncbi:MAG: lysophospholipase [Candidatus Limnocylindrales bacterium]
MTPTESSLIGAGGVRLQAYRWAPLGHEAGADPAPRAAVAIVHGFGEHAGRYSAVVDALTARGFAVHGFDLRGHGRSPGRRGHIDAWADYRDDLLAFLDHVRAHEPPGTPVFVYGHSLGGAIALELGLREPMGLAGLVASGPALVPTGVRSPALEAVGRVLSRAWPTFSIQMPLEREHITRSPEVLAATRADPLNHRTITARAATVTLPALAWARANAAGWRLPLLVIHGGGDRIIDPEGSRAFVAAAREGGAPDVELRIYEGGYHEPHNDLDAPRVMADVADWLERHLPS